jgi:signal peptidase I
MARQGRASRHGSLVELVVIVAVALGLAVLIQAFVVKPYRIPSASMEPTLAIGQRILVDRIGNRFGDPAVGDIVVFHPPATAENATGSQCGSPPPPGQVCVHPSPQASPLTYIKRVVAVPGDRIKLVDGHVIRNGKRAAEPFIRPCGGGPDCTMPAEVTIPKGEYFMMGDNRGLSDDSRFWGAVPRGWIIGGAFLTYWPPNRVGLI